MSSFTVGGINYVVTSSTSPRTVAVGVNATATGSISIPASVTNATITYSVTSIADYAFQYRTGVTSVTIPSSVKSIGAGAFQNCAFSSVTIPSSVTSIGYSAFEACSSLTSIIIPYGVTSIGGNAFNNCSNLSSVTIPSTVTTFGSSPFNNCSRLTSVTCYIATPPANASSIFYAVNKSTCNLLVPSASLSAYQNAAIWNTFKTVTAATPEYIPPTAPSVPTIGIPTPGNAQVSLAFTPSASTGGAAVTYTATSSPGGITKSGSASPLTVTGLTNGTPYTFTVVASNSAGSSAASGASTSVTPATVPGAPTIGTAVRGNSGEAIVSFTAPGSNGGATITGYTATSNPGGFTKSGTTASPLTVTGLTNGTSYTFTVKANNSAGSSLASGASTSVTPATVPGAPTGVTAVRGNSGEAIVSFTAPGSNGGAAITEYTVTSNPGGITKSGSASSLTVTGLTNGTAYTFTVVAKNAALFSSAPSGSSNSVIPLTASTASLKISKGISDLGISGIMSKLFAKTVVNGSVVDIGALDMPNPNSGVDLEDKKRTTKQIINTIFENKPSADFFKVKSSDLAIAAENVKENLIIVKNVTDLSSPFVLDGMLDSKTGVYAALENVGDINKFQLGTDIIKVVKTVLGYAFTDSNNVTTPYLVGDKLNYKDLVLIFGGLSLSANDVPGFNGNANTPVVVNLDVNVDANGEIQILGAAALVLTNVIVADTQLPASALYRAATPAVGQTPAVPGNSMFEFWEPTNNALTPNLDLTGLIYAERSSITGDWKTLTRSLENGLHACLKGPFSAIHTVGSTTTIAAPFNDAKYTANAEQYRKANSFGDLALATLAHYIMGHVAATASITNDKNFVDAMNSSDFIPYVAGDLDTAKKLEYSDDYTSVSPGTSSDAKLAKLLINAIATKTNDKVDLIARQVIGQDASRAMDQDNNKPLPNVRQPLKFIAGDIIYMNIKLQQPTVTIGTGQKVSKDTLQAKFSNTAVSDSNYTLKITLK